MLRQEISDLMIACDRSNTFSLFPTLELLPDAAVSAPVLLLVDSLPLGDRNFICSIAATAPRKSVLKHPRLMLEEILIFGAFCANIEPHLLLTKCPIHRLSWEWETGTLRKLLPQILPPMSKIAC